MTLILHKWSNFFEKVKNLITWQDPIRTTMFLAFLMFLYCAISVLGSRTLFLASVWSNFYFGLFYYKKLYPNNNKVVWETLRLVCHEYLPDHKEAIEKGRKNPWPTTINLNSFQRKVKFDSFHLNVIDSRTIPI